MSDHQTKSRTELLEYIAMLETKAKFLQDTIEEEFLDRTPFHEHVLMKNLPEGQRNDDYVNDMWGCDLTSDSVKREHCFLAKHFKEDYEYSIMLDTEQEGGASDFEYPARKIQALWRGYDCRWKNPYFTFTD